MNILLLSGTRELTELEYLAVDDLVDASNIEFIMSTRESQYAKSRNIPLRIYTETYFWWNGIPIRRVPWGALLVSSVGVFFNGDDHLISNFPNKKVLLFV